MKLGLKSALGLAAAHLVLVIALAVGVEGSLRSLEETLSADTVRLLAREQANLVFERSVAALRYPDADSRRRLHERIEDLTVLSEVVTSLAVVDAAGRVVASEVPEGRGRFAPAAQLFGDPPRLPPRAERPEVLHEGRRLRGPRPARRGRRAGRLPPGRAAQRPDRLALRAGPITARGPGDPRARGRGRARRGPPGPAVTAGRVDRLGARGSARAAARRSPPPTSSPGCCAARAR